MADIPSYDSAEISRALALLKAGNPTEAAQIVNAYLKDYPDSAPAHAALGAILMGQKKIHEAAQVLSKSLSLAPDSRDGYGRLARCLVVFSN